MELNEETIDYNDLLTQLRMLAKFGSRIDRYWEIATFDQRRDILGSMFTNVPTCENYELTNIEISPLYQALRDISENHVLHGRGSHALLRWPVASGTARCCYSRQRFKIVS